MLKHPLLGTRDINDTIDNGVGDVDALRAEFSSKRLRQGAERKFAGCKGCECR